MERERWGTRTGQTWRVGVRQQMGDPWGIVTAVLAGGLGGAVTVAVWAGR